MTTNNQRLTLTDEQKIFLDTPLSSEGIAVVQAYAGSGKTSTLAAYIESRPRSNFLYLAFNRAMAEEANIKFKQRNMKNVTARTMHSIAYPSFGAKEKDRIGNIRPSDLIHIVKKSFSCSNAKTINTITWLLLAQINKFMSSDAIKPSEYFLTTTLKDKQTRVTVDILQQSVSKIAHVLDLTWTAILTGDTSYGPALPFPHNAYLKRMQLSAAPLNFDTILIDEAQDVTPCMINIVMRQKASKIFIGDTYQQIYSWNGAVNSLKSIINMGAATYYLTKSFRCPGDIAALADPYLKLLGANKDFQGTNIKIKGNPTYIAHIYRSNAGVFAYALSEMKNLEPVHYLGGFKNYNFWELVDIAYMASGHHEKIKDVFYKQFSGIDDFKEYAEATKDISLECKIKIVERYGAEAVPGLYWGLREFSASLDASTSLLVTGHKAKGQEWCYTTLGTDFISINSIVKKITTGQIADAELPYEINQEELRLLYVAITRSYGKIAIPETLILTEETVETFHDLLCQNKIVLT